MALAGRRPDEPLCVDLDATLITAHSDDKDCAAVTYKKGWGFHPLLAYLDRGDGLGESLGGQLRPGNAGSARSSTRCTSSTTTPARASPRERLTTLERGVLGLA